VYVRRHDTRASKVTTSGSAGTTYVQKRRDQRNGLVSGQVEQEEQHRAQGPLLSFEHADPAAAADGVLDHPASFLGTEVVEAREEGPGALEVVRDGPGVHRVRVQSDPLVPAPASPAEGLRVRVEVRENDPDVCALEA
jgi:hypothetical protein